MQPPGKGVLVINGRKVGVVETWEPVRPAVPLMADIRKFPEPTDTFIVGECIFNRKALEMMGLLPEFRESRPNRAQRRAAKHRSP